MAPAPPLGGGLRAWHRRFVFLCSGAPSVAFSPVSPVAPFFPSPGLSPSDFPSDEATSSPSLIVMGFSISVDSLVVPSDSFATLSTLEPGQLFFWSISSPLRPIAIVEADEFFAFPRIATRYILANAQIRLPSGVYPVAGPTRFWFVALSSFSVA